MQKESNLVGFSVGAILGFAVSTAFIFGLLSSSVLGTLTLLVGGIIGSLCALVAGYSMAKGNKVRIGIYCAALVLAFWIFIFVFITPASVVVS
jgi:hypothetical protein